MRRIIEYTLISLDGVFAGAAAKRFSKGIVKLTYETQH